jgi:signal transduction histidine kinase
LLKDIIAPVVDQMVSLLKRHNLARRGIEVGNFQWIPRIWVQTQALSQVFFNLLSNAIKYRFKDPSAFHVKIMDDREAAHYLVRVQNWGPGVEEAEKDLIFETGYRGSASTKYDVSGHGYGLAIARDILREHGGDLRLTRLNSPTEFTLVLPRSLAQRPPKLA